MLAYDIRYIHTVSYSILNLVGNQASAHESLHSYVPVAHDLTSWLLSNRNNRPVRLTDEWKSCQFVVFSQPGGQPICRPPMT